MQTLGDFEIFPKEVFLYLCANHLNIKTIGRFACVNMASQKLMKEDDLWRQLCKRHYPDKIESKNNVSSFLALFKELWSTTHRDQTRVILHKNALGVSVTERGIWFPVQLGDILPETGTLRLKFRLTDPKESFFYPGVSDQSTVKWTESTLPTYGDYGKFYKSKYVIMTVDCTQRTLSFETDPPQSFGSPKSFAAIPHNRAVVVCSFLYCEPIYFCPNGIDPVEE